MVGLLAVEAEVEVAEATRPTVCSLVNVSQLLTARDRAPAHVVHLGDSVLKGHLLVQLREVVVKLQVLDVSIVERLPAATVPTYETGDLSIVNLLDDHRVHALMTEAMGTPREKEELTAKDFSRANATFVQLFIKCSPVSLLG